MPEWAKPTVDDLGNVTVSFGKGGKPLIFVAHMDEVGFEITGIADNGTAAARTRGGMYLSVYEAHPVNVVTPKGLVPAILTPRHGYTTAKESQPDVKELALYFGTESAAETSALGVAVGQSATVRKQFMSLGTQRATGRSMDDRNGSAALLLALQQIDPATVENQVTFAWSVEEETGLTGAQHLAKRFQPDTAFAVDTFVSTDTPVDIQRLAGAKLGQGAVLRVLDSRTIVPPHIVDRIVGVARVAQNPVAARDNQRRDRFERVQRRWCDRCGTLVARTVLALAGRNHGQARSRSARPPHRRIGAKLLNVTTAPYGTWKSPLTAARATAGALRFDHPVIDGDDVYWVEGRASEGGRNVIVRHSRDGRLSDVTPLGYNVRSRVHEYGGAAYSVYKGTVYFSNFADQRLYRQTRTSSPQPMTAEGYFYADSSMDPVRNRLLCVREDHTYERRHAEAINTIVAVPTDGGVESVLVSGADFYSDPILSPDGSRLAWLQWNHPNMPWDGTELWVAEMDANGAIGPAQRMAGGPRESIFQPVWSPDGALFFVSDRTGWWNLYRLSGCDRCAGATGANGEGASRGAACRGAWRSMRFFRWRRSSGSRNGCSAIARMRLSRPTDWSRPIRKEDGGSLRSSISSHGGFNPLTFRSKPSMGSAPRPARPTSLEGLRRCRHRSSAWRSTVRRPPASQTASKLFGPRRRMASMRSGCPCQKPSATSPRRLVRMASGAFMPVTTHRATLTIKRPPASVRHSSS